MYSWFVHAYMHAFHDVCTTALAPLASGKEASALLVHAVDTCFQWVLSRQKLAIEADILLGDMDASTLLAHCKTVFSAAMQPGVREAIVGYLGNAVQVWHATKIVLDPLCVQVCAQLRFLGLDAVVQSAMTQTATQLLEEAVQYATSRPEALRAPVYPALHALLSDQLVPALTSMLDARPSELAMMPTSVMNAWDVSVSMFHDDTPRQEMDQNWLYLRLEYSLAKIMGKHRLAQLFALVGAYPYSRAAMQDMVVWLAKTDERMELAHAFSHALHTRLLHPDVDTHAILVYYVNIVYALRLVDTSGVVLSRTLPLVQQYLRKRPDTIHAIVQALLGDDAAFELLRTEFVQVQPDKEAPGQVLDVEDEDEQYTRLEYWVDPTWAPRPVDAGPAFSQMRTRDVVGLLVSIFDDRQGFLRALEQHTAQRLVRTMDYDTTRVQHNNAIFKRRLGAQSLHHCDVMLADVAMSRRLDRSFHKTRRDAFEHVHPMVVSRQFWPDLDTRTFTLPRRLANALEQFAAFYAETHPSKRVRWLPHVGSVDVEIELRRGHRIAARVSPLQLAVAELIAGLNDAATAVTVTADDVARALKLDDQTLALETLRFWTAQGVLRELPSPASGTFELCDDAPLERA